MIEAILACATLIAVDGDTIKCDGENMRLLGGGVPFVSGIDTPETGGRAKCEKERKLALLAKYRLNGLLKENDLAVVYSGFRDKTQQRRRLIDIYDSDGNELGQKLLNEGFARPWKPHHKIDWCD